MAESNNKDVIYIDIDDEITAVIDKVRSSKHQIVALVLPKRATTLQSIVNMKLLKRTADEAKKNVVLITSEEGLMPLAGNVGIHVARSLQTKPEIPSAPDVPEADANDAKEAIDLNDEEDEEPKLDSNKSVGELAGIGGAAAAGAGLAKAEEESIELDNSDAQPGDDTDQGKDKSKKGKPAKNKKLHVPNFERFRLWIILGGLALVVLIVLLILSVSILPKASITIKTNSQTINTNEQVTLSSNASSANPSQQTVPAQVAQTQKTYTGTVNTTGQQNNGQKASGQITISLNDCSQPSVVIPSGTGVSTNGMTFITQSSATLNSVEVAGKCANSKFPNLSTSSVDVEAQVGGSSYNVQPTTFSVSGFSDVSASSSSAMTGGTDDIVQVITQNDINNAQNKINANNDSIKSELESDLQSQGLFPVVGTFSTGTPNTTNSATVGSPANQVTVTEAVTYTMYGAKRSDLQAVIAANVDSQIDTSKQKILNYGLNSANFTTVNQGSNSVVVNMQVSSLAGSSLDVAQIKKQSAGEKPGTAASTIKGYPGVTNVSVNLSPFFVSSIPNNTSKITVNIENP